MTEKNEYTFLVERMDADGTEVKAEGYVRGVMHKGDVCLAYVPGYETYCSEVKGIMIKGEEKEIAAEEKAVITIHAKDFPLYTVLTNISDRDPSLEAMLREFKRNMPDKEFVRAFTSVLVHAELLAAVEEGDGMMKFPFLTGTDGSTAMPVFTTREELGKWKSLCEKEEHIKITKISFLQVSGISLSNNDGVVINAFSKYSMFMPNVFLKEVRGKNAEAKLVEKNIPNGTEAMIGKPKDDEKTKAVIKELVLAGSEISEIRRIWLLYQIIEGEAAWLCVVDCDKEKLKDIYPLLHSRILGYMNEGEYVDYITPESYLETPLEEYKPIYTRGN